MGIRSLFERFTPAWFERHLPLIGALVAAIVLLWLAPYISDLIDKQCIVLSNIYTAAFGWSAVQTSFAFGVYAYVAGNNGDFFKKFRDTPVYDRFLMYAHSANWAGYALTFGTLPFLVSNVPLGAVYSKSFLAVIAWFSLLFYAVLSFLRVARTFHLLALIKDRKLHLG
jgi:uncharacterized membrane protein YeiH